MPLKRSKKYTPSEKEKYMCSKHKTFFKARLMEWRKEIIVLRVHFFTEGWVQITSKMSNKSYNESEHRRVNVIN